MDVKGEGWDLPIGASPWSSFHWFRVSARTTLSLVVLSEAPYWYLGHFVDGRMSPCEGVPCALCAEGIGQQARFVFAVGETTTKRAGLVELSQSIAELLRNWAAEHGGIRGMWIELFKHSASIKSRTEVRCIREDPGHWWMGLEVPSPVVALELTWKKMGCKRSSTRERVLPPSRLPK